MLNIYCNPRKFTSTLFLSVLLVLTGILHLKAQSVELDASDLTKFTSSSFITPVTYKGKKAIRFADNDGYGEVAILKDVTFSEGTIEAELAGSLLPDADTSYRGFIGIAFRVQNDSTYDCFYLRPTNGRAPDQLRRNHSTQYISHPEYPWYRLRNETPGVYESYVDLVPGEWTKVRIVVKNKSAELYVNDAPQPCLVVNRLKSTADSGGIALWIGWGTDGYFSSLRIEKN